MTPSGDQALVDGQRHWLQATAGGLAGLAIPLIASGPTPTLIALVLSLGLFLASPVRAVACKAWATSLMAPLGIAVAVLLIAFLPSAIASIDPGRSFGVWGRMSALILAASLLYQFLRASDTALRSALCSLVAASLFFAMIGLLGVFVYAPIYTIFRGTLAETPQPAQLLKGYASAVCCLIPVVIWAGSQLSRRWRYAGWLYAPLALALILGAASIAGLVGLTAALVIGGVTWILLQTSSRPQRALTVFMCTAAVVAVAALALVFSQLPVPPPLEQLTGATYDQPMEIGRAHV